MRRAIALVGAIVLLLGTSTAASEQGPRGTATCRARATPGRVLCEAELEVSSGRVEWADVLVVEAPEFAPPLRSRVGPRQAVARSARRIRFPLALVATDEGEGTLRLRLRAVRCEGETRCAPVTLELDARVRVGPTVR